jgi:cysteine synthase
MIEDAERRALLGPGATIIEPTAGNTGIGLALVARARGYRVVLCIPAGYSSEKMQVMQALGAELVVTPAERGMLGAIERATELAARTPGSFIPQQFENPANPQMHYATTGAEIYEQMDGRIDAAVIGCGSGGTFSGVCRYLRERIDGLLCIAVESQGSVLGGGPPGPKKIEGIGSSFIPGNFDRSLCDEIMMADDVVAYAMARRLAAEEGVLSGGSGGANVWAAVVVARRLGAGRRVVTIVPDPAERYLSKGIYADVVTGEEI